MDVVDDKISTGKRYIDYVDENFIYDDCASLPNYIMCAPQRAVLATTAESGFFVGAFSLFCPAAAQTSASSACLCGAHSWVFFLCFHWRFARFVLRKVCFLPVLERSTAFWGDGGSEEGAEGTEEGRLSIRFLTRPSARVLLLETGRRWREPCCGLRCWRFCWFV